MLIRLDISLSKLLCLNKRRDVPASAGSSTVIEIMTRQEESITGQATRVGLCHDIGFERLSVLSIGRAEPNLCGLVHARRKTRLDGRIYTSFLYPYLLRERLKDEQATIAPDATTICN